MRAPYLTGLLGVLGFLGACTFRPVPASVNVRWDRASAAAFDCVGVLITGEGIPSLSPDADWSAVYHGGQCPYPGVSTSLLAVDAEKDLNFSLRVPSGVNRTVQVVGVSTSDSSCPAESVSELILANQRGTLPVNVTGIFELGRATTDLLRSTALTIANAYSASTAFDLRTCTTSSSANSGPLSLPSSTLNLFVTDIYKVVPSGGNPPFRFDSAGISGSIDSRGVYTAGVSAASETVVVTDSKGATASRSVAILNPDSVSRRHWFSAKSFNDLGDGTVLTGTAKWLNLGNGAITFSELALAGVARSVASYSQAGGAGGFPALRIGSGAVFSGPVSMSGGHAVVAVLRRQTAGTDPFFCIHSGFGACAGATQRTAVHYSVSSSGTATFDLEKPGGDPPILANSTASGDGTDWTLVRTRFTMAPGGSAVVTNGDGLEETVGHAITSLNISGTFRLGGDQGGATADIEIGELMYFDGAYDYTTIVANFQAKYNLP